MTAPWIDAVLVASYGPMVTTFATLFSAIAPSNIANPRQTTRRVRYKFPIASGKP